MEANIFYCFLNGGAKEILKINLNGSNQMHLATFSQSPPHPESASARIQRSKNSCHTTLRDGTEVVHMCACDVTHTNNNNLWHVLSNSCELLLFRGKTIEFELKWVLSHNTECCQWSYRVRFKILQKKRFLIEKAIFSKLMKQ